MTTSTIAMTRSGIDPATFRLRLDALPTEPIYTYVPNICFSAYRTQNTSTHSTFLYRCTCHISSRWQGYIIVWHFSIQSLIELEWAQMSYCLQWPWSRLPGGDKHFYWQIWYAQSYLPYMCRDPQIVCSNPIFTLIVILSCRCSLILWKWGTYTIFNFRLSSKLKAVFLYFMVYRFSAYKLDWIGRIKILFLWLNTFKILFDLKLYWSVGYVKES